MQCLDDNSVQGFVLGQLDPSTRIQVEAHLDGCKDCRQLTGWALQAVRSGERRELTSTTKGTPGSSAPDALAANEELPLGTAIGRYILLKRLGAGGMGVVYLAHDPDLDRRIALKLIRGGGNRDDQDAERQQRFLREARAMARPQHPEVISIYDVSVALGRVFIAMEFVDGTTLRGWLASEPRSWRQVLSMFIRVGHGLAAAHAAGLVHRDFKPDNVLVGSDGRVRVTDFGLASLLESHPAEPELQLPNDAPADRITRSGQFLGSPAYAAPEQMQGRPADPRADIFSFSVALYEALYGERPFSGQNIEQLRSALAADRVRPAPRGRRVPRAVRAVLLGALKHDPAARPPNMRALLDHLRRARHPNRWLAAAVAVAGLSALALFISLRAPKSAGDGWQRAALRDVPSVNEGAIMLRALPELVCLEPGGIAQVSTEMRDVRAIKSDLRRSQLGPPFWISADPAIATVSASGRVVAGAPGRTALFATTAELRSNAITVSVAPPPRGRMAYDALDVATGKPMVRLVDLDGANPRTIAEGWSPRLSPDQGAVVYQRGSPEPWGPGDSLYLYDLRTGVERVLKVNTDYIVSSSFSNDGKRVFFDYECSMLTVGRGGDGEAVLFPSTDCFDDSPDVNPVDGSVAFQNIQSNDFITIISGDGDPATRRTVPGTANDYNPRWSPDGVQLAVWHGDSKYKGRIDTLRADGSGRFSLLPFAADEHNYVKHGSGAYTPDGYWLLTPVTRGDASSSAIDIEALATDGSGCARSIPVPAAASAGFVGSIR